MFYFTSLKPPSKTQDYFTIDQVIGVFDTLAEAQLFAKDYSAILKDTTTKLNILLIQESEINVDYAFVAWFNNESQNGNIVLMRY